MNIIGVLINVFEKPIVIPIITVLKDMLKRLLSKKQACAFKLYVPVFLRNPLAKLRKYFAADVGSSGIRLSTTFHSAP